MRMLMITAMHSGAGKTVMTCALMAALKNRGLQIQAFKYGPDYIDPMFHREVLGIPSRNLDLFLQGEEGVREAMACSGAGFGIVEGAMGYYDGIGGTDRASCWELARHFGIPAVLVLRPKGNGITLAAQVKGMLSFRPDSRICGLLLTDCTPRLAQYLQPILERETKLPVLGALPPMPEAEIPSRHLGLMTAGEIADLSERVKGLAKAAEKHLDIDRLLALAAIIQQERESHSGRDGKTGDTGQEGSLREREHKGNNPGSCRIAVARDEAFCFIYEENLDALRKAGAELCFFSPLRDAALPEAVSALYLPGGYPELYAARLSENAVLRSRISSAVLNGMPTVAECGGFLYLQQCLEDPDGTPFPMCGVLPGKGFRTTHLQRFGYLTLRAERDSLLFRSGETVPAHEFHYWESSEPGRDLTAEKANGKRWHCAYTGDHLYAGFPHLHFGGEQPLAERFERAGEAWMQVKN